MKARLLHLIFLIIIMTALTGILQARKSSHFTDYYNDYYEFSPPVDMYYYSLSKRPKSHKALDIRAPLGTYVYASKAGKVTWSKYLGAYGLVIFIEHEGGYQTRYAHLKKMFVKKGQEVKRGDKIGMIGMTGRTTGPHLHFEIRYGKYLPQQDRYKYERYEAKKVIELINVKNWSWN